METTGGQTRGGAGHRRSKEWQQRWIETVAVRQVMVLEHRAGREWQRKTVGDQARHGARTPFRQEEVVVKGNHGWQGGPWCWRTIEAGNGGGEEEPSVITVKATSADGEGKPWAVGQVMGLQSTRMAWWSTGYDLATCAAWYYQGGTKSAQGLTPDPMWHCSLTTSNDRRQAADEEQARQGVTVVKGSYEQ
ncbi:hypothetical protein F5887DRAFT_918150 [Amanita rubescens]|nr:hypothetical protein F5887DRAFT_918150 [Amanita rubescens]